MGMDPFPITALTEEDLDRIVEAAGGERAHPDADRRDREGADYLLGTTMIELKMLDDEGFSKPERQARLAGLFSALEPDRPVVVLDPARLSPPEQLKYRRIIEGPVKRAVTKARAQLIQSRTERPEAKGSVLWIVNNGYTSLDHDSLEEIVANRVRQDTTHIDGVIVSGCYYHSDGFDSVFLWPCTYVPINAAYAFPEFDALQDAFQDFAGEYMTALVQQEVPAGAKLPVADVTFDLDGVRFVRVAPPMGRPSDFYINGRPRANSTGFEKCPPVALIVPDLARAEHDLVRAAVGKADGPLSSYEAWLEHIAEAAAAATPLKPLVAMPVRATEWLDWCREAGMGPSHAALRAYAHDLFTKPMLDLLSRARERKRDGLVLSSYVLALTEEIGQDCANDVSHIALVRERPEGDPVIRPLVENLRIFHEHALALAAAYALSRGIGAVQWQKNRQYSWT
jgi:hypothetical protein